MNAPSSETHFDVGEIAIAVNSVEGRIDGSEVEVTHPYGLYLHCSGEMVMAYVVEHEGCQYLARPWQLRKKKPPREDLQVTRWDQCPWQPETIDV